MHHFCHDLPVLLVGCKKDLRNDPATIEELRKNSQRPVAFEEVFSGEMMLVAFWGSASYAIYRLW